MLFRMIHVQSLIRDILHLVSENVRERKEKKRASESKIEKKEEKQLQSI